jgi:hypothetical protein
MVVVFFDVDFVKSRSGRVGAACDFGGDKDKIEFTKGSPLDG